MKTSSLLLLAALVLAPLGAAGDNPVPKARPSLDVLRKNVERWKALPQQERDRIKHAYAQYKQQSTPEQHEVVAENLRKFRELPPDRRRELTKKLEGLPPQQRWMMAHKLRQLQQMGADRQKMAFMFARMAQSLTPDQKRQLEQLETRDEKKQFLGRIFRQHVLGMYLEGKSAEDRAKFEALSQPEQKRQLQQFFKERVVRAPPDRGGGK